MCRLCTVLYCALFTIRSMAYNFALNYTKVQFSYHNRLPGYVRSSNNTFSCNWLKGNQTKEEFVAVQC